MLARMDKSDPAGLIGDILRLGRIASVDLETATAIVECGEITSPNIPWTEWAGAFRTWSPPSVGEQILLLCPEGDIAGGIILRGLNCATFPTPASDENHQIFGTEGLIIKLTASGLEITAPGDVSITGNVAIKGDVTIEGKAAATGLITSDADVNAGSVSLKTHIHTGVTAGAAISGPPQ